MIAPVLLSSKSPSSSTNPTFTIFAVVIGIAEVLGDSVICISLVATSSFSGEGVKVATAIILHRDLVV